MTNGEMVRLADITTKVGSGSTPRGGEAAYKPEGVPLIRSMNVHFDGFRRDGLAFLDDEQASALKNVEVSAGDVLLNITGASIGRVTIAPAAMSGARVNQHVCIIRPDARLDSSFLRWYLASPSQQRLINGIESGATRQALTKEKILGFQIPLPSVDVQRQIVAEIEKQFSRLDEAVANLKRVKANLKRYKAAVLNAAVEGRLVPTEAELARREGRSYETGAQLLERILETIRNSWKGRGKYKKPAEPRSEWQYELPDGWAWATLGSLALSVKDGPHYSPQYADEGIPFISGGNIRPEGIDFSSTKFISSELHAELSKRCRPEFGDLLYTKGGTTGIARINTESREFNVWVHVAVLKLVNSVHPFYVQHALNSQHCYRQAQQYTHGVGNQDLGLTRMVWITVPLPPRAEQDRIVVEVDRRLSLVRGVETEIDSNLRRAQALRNGVLRSKFGSGRPGGG